MCTENRPNDSNRVYTPCKAILCDLTVSSLAEKDRWVSSDCLEVLLTSAWPWASMEGDLCTVMPVQDAITWRNRQSQARRLKLDPGLPPLPTKIMANWIGELCLLSLVVTIISRYSCSNSTGVVLWPRIRVSNSRASSLRPTEARYRGLSGSILTKRARMMAGMHWKASKKRHLTSE